MDIISDRKLEKNILQWYPMEKNLDTLQIGYIDAELVRQLCDKTRNVTILVQNEEEKQKILQNSKRDNLKVKVVQDFENYSDNEYDYVTLIGTLKTFENKIEVKAYRRLEFFLKLAKKMCKENGKIILVLDNKYGMKSWTTLKANKNIICNQTYALSQKLINRLLEEQNLTEYKYYYVLPDYKATNAIFTDEYLPNLESINRNFLYGEEEFENFNQTEAYIELLKEEKQSFKFFANSYFVEIGKSKLEPNGIRFVSYTNIRREKYKIQTIIYEDRVEKTYANDMAKEHIQTIHKNIDIMNQKNIKTLDKYENGKIISKYIKDFNSYDKILTELLENKKEAEFFETITNYKNTLLEKLEEVDYNSIKENNVFTKYGVNVEKEMIQKLHFVKYGLWDLIFHNAFYINEEIYFYDQEWFDYNVPIEFIIYRAIAYFPIAHSYIRTNELYERLGLNEFLKIFEDLDSKLQLEIRDNEIWKLHTSTRTGQTLFDLYKNLVVEFMEYKKVYNLNTIREISEENKRLRQEIERLNQEKERIYASTSWKVTKPVRWLGKNLKRGNTGGK